MEEPRGYIDTEVDGLVVPLKVEARQIIDPEHLSKNIAFNIKRDVLRFVNRPNLTLLKHEPMAIVAAGPTLNDTIEQLREFKNILVCGSAHDHLVRLGVIPTYALVSDGGVDDKLNLSLRNKETTYLIASQCDPSLFDHLEGYNVEMWHYKGQTGSPEDEKALLRGEQAIAWGSTVTINAVHVALLLGHQDLHFFGFDSCYGDHGLKQHCCEIVGGLEYQKIPVKVAGTERMFISDYGLMEQANQFFKLMEFWRQFFHTTIYGDGLIAAMVRNGEPGLSDFVTLA